MPDGSARRREKQGKLISITATSAAAHFPCPSPGETLVDGEADLERDLFAVLSEEHARSRASAVIDQRAGVEAAEQTRASGDGGRGGGGGGGIGDGIGGGVSRSVNDHISTDTDGSSSERTFIRGVADTSSSTPSSSTPSSSRASATKDLLIDGVIADVLLVRQALARRNDPVRTLLRKVATYLPTSPHPLNPPKHPIHSPPSLSTPPCPGGTPVAAHHRNLYGQQNIPCTDRASPAQTAFRGPGSYAPTLPCTTEETHWTGVGSEGTIGSRYWHCSYCCYYCC